MSQTFLVREESRVRRARLGLSLAAVGQRVGVSLSLVSAWEREEAPVRKQYQRELARVLGGRKGLFREVARGVRR